jgi:hypothetical protein
MKDPKEVPMAKQKVQGEGDYEATRRYRKRTDEFLKNNDVEKAAIRAAPTTKPEAAGKRRATGEDPALRRRAAPRVEPSTRGKTSRH